jgi:hypothetical protein
MLYTLQFDLGTQVSSVNDQQASETWLQRSTYVLYDGLSNSLES